MKRIPFYIAIALMLLLTAAAILWHHSHNASNTDSTNPLLNAQASAGSEKAAPSNSRTDQPSKGIPHQIDPLAAAGITPDMTQAQREQKYAEWYIREAAKLVPEQKPFAFYGMVVDENTQAVAGASVHFGLRTTSSADGTLQVNDASATDGSFSLAKGTGSHLHVDVWKTGYYNMGSQNQTEFDDTTGGNSSKENPVLFHLRKKGEGVNLITSQYGMTPDFLFSTPLDGTPVRVDFFNRKLSGEGQMEISAVKPDRLKQERTSEWSFKMSIPDGGFIEEADEFPFEAPESGYQPTIEFHFKAGDTNWTDTIHKSYYIAFGQSRKYGRLDLDTQMYWGTRLTYTINPDGSRYLEPKQ